MKDQFVHSVVLDFDDDIWMVHGNRLWFHPDVLEWCIEQYGKPFVWDENKKMNWAFYAPISKRWLSSRPVTLYFNDADDALMFKMMWSGVKLECNRK